MTTANQIEAEAVSWLLDPEAMDCTPEWHAARDQWLAADPRHRKAYLLMHQCYEKADALQRFRPADGTLDMDITRKCSVLHAPEGLLPEPEPTRVAWALPAIAATVVVTAVTFFWTTTSTSTHDEGTWAAYESEGVQHDLTLEDGSVVNLDSNTQLRVRYTSHEREVELIKGRAIFSVRKEERPFAVLAGPKAVRAIGTEFLVSLLGATPKVIVKEGSVLVAPKGDRSGTSGEIVTSRGGKDRIIVPEGYETEDRPDGMRLIKRAPKDIDREFARTRGMLYFDDEPFGDVVAEFNRHNQRKFSIADPTIAAERVSVTFPNSKPEMLMNFARGQFNVRAVQSASNPNLTILQADRSGE